MATNSEPLADGVQKSLFGTMDKYAEDVAMYANKELLSEQDLIKFQMASSRFNMITQLATNLVKGLTDSEKAIAQKM